MKIFQYEIKGGIIRTNGVTRLHHASYKTSYYRGYSIGVNIIPKRFGVCLYIGITNTIKELESVVEYHQNKYKDLLELIKVVYGGW